MIKIAHIADVHLRSAQYQRTSRGYDFFKGFMNSLKVSVANGADCILCAGDVVDKTHPSAEVVTVQLREADRYLKENNTVMYVTSGNHDATKPHWCTGLEFIKVIDNEVVNIGGSGITVRGLPYMSPSELRETLEAVDPTDIVMWHGEIKDFGGYPKANTIEIADFPEGKWKLVAMGDQHIHKKIEREVDSLIVAYPGSTELCSASEDPQKHIYMYTFDEGTHTIASIESIPFETRKVQKFVLKTEDDVEAALLNIDPTAILFVDYDRNLNNVVPRLNSVRTDENILQARLLADDSVSAFEVIGGVDEDLDMSPVEFMRTYIADVTDADEYNRISKLCTFMVDSKLDHRVELEKFCEEYLGEIVL